MKIGYARVSTDAQSTQLQLDQLAASGCEKVFQDEGISGANPKRPQLARCMKMLLAGDVLIVARLDRLGRSLSDLISTVNTLRDRGVAFQSLTEAIDTTSAAGTLVFHLLGALAQFERTLIMERTGEGIKAARARGVRFGRPRALSDEQVQHARALLEAGKPHREIAKLLGTSRATIYRLFPARWMGLPS